MPVLWRAPAGVRRYDNGSDAVSAPARGEDCAVCDAGRSKAAVAASEELKCVLLRLLVTANVRNFDSRNRNRIHANLLSPNLTRA